MLRRFPARFGQVQPDEWHVVARRPRHHRVRKVRVMQRLDRFVQAERSAHRDDDESMHAEKAKTLDLLLLAVESVRARGEEKADAERVSTLLRSVRDKRKERTAQVPQNE